LGFDRGNSIASIYSADCIRCIFPDGTWRGRFGSGWARMHRAPADKGQCRLFSASKERPRSDHAGASRTNPDCRRDSVAPDHM